MVQRFQSEYYAVMQMSMHAAPSAALSETESGVLWDLLVEVPPDGIVVETGCQLGRSSSLVLGAQRLRGFHSIHIDPYTAQPEIAEEWLRGMVKIQDETAREFVLCCMRTEQAAWLLSKFGQIDFAFIDGDHEYAGVKVDMELIASRIKRGGVLACHDVDHIHFPGVRQAVEEFLDPGWHLVGYFDSLGVWRRK